MGEVQGEGLVAAFYDPPNQVRAKRARLNSPESEQAGSPRNAGPLVFEKEVLGEGEEIDPDEPLDAVPRREFSLLPQKSELIVSRGCHPVCRCQSQPFGGGLTEFPSSAGHQSKPSMALGKIKRRDISEVSPTANRLYDCTDSWVDKSRLFVRDKSRILDWVEDYKVPRIR